MRVARQLFDLAHGRATGSLRLRLPAHPQFSTTLVLDHGWVHARVSGGVSSVRAPLSANGERALVELLELTAHGLECEFAPSAPPPVGGSLTPFHPARAVRQYAETIGVNFTRPASTRVRVTLVPHASSLDDDERALVSLLSSERTLAQLDTALIALPQRTRRLLGFLDAVGALAVAAPSADLALFELTEDASLDDIRAAWRRFARQHHPDLNPAGGTDRFAELSAAYRRLLGE